MGERAYRAAYQHAMTLLPTPRSSLDPETTFGRVRVYEFGAASDDPAAIPVLLLPGRTSGVPMWAYNLPDLATARTTYAPVDPDDPMTRMISEATEHYAVKLPPPKRLTPTQLQGLHMPVYAALAGRSAMHNGAHAADVARAEIPDLTIELWSDATHSLPMEQATTLDRTILTFMATHHS